MRHLAKVKHPSITSESNLSVFKRISTRAICINESDILLLYTQRYDDYSLPGGGVGDGENMEDALKRELSEETGAHNIRNITPFGLYEELRPWYKPDFDLVHMYSYCYTCQIDKELGQTALEDYEVNNGMNPVWTNIDMAIEHNKNTLAKSAKKGLSIERELFLLELIKKELITSST